MWKQGTELVLKESIFFRYWALLFVPFLVMIFSTIYNIFEEARPTIAIVGVVALIILLFVVFYRKNKNSIIIGKQGIYTEDSHCIEWDVINYVYIYQEGTKNSRLYLTIEYRDTNENVQNKKINVNKLSYSENDIEQAVNYWSGRNIGSMALKKRDEMLKRKLESHEITEEEAKAFYSKSNLYIPLFRNQVKKELTVALSIMTAVIFLFLGCTFLLADVFEPYHSKLSLSSLLICVFSLGGFIMSLGSRYVQKTFLKDDRITILTEKERQEFYKINDSDEYNYSFIAACCAIIALISGVIMAITW